MLDTASLLRYEVRDYLLNDNSSEKVLVEESSPESRPESGATVLDILQELGLEKHCSLDYKVNIYTDFGNNSLMIEKKMQEVYKTTLSKNGPMIISIGERVNKDLIKKYTRGTIYLSRSFIENTSIGDIVCGKTSLKRRYKSVSLELHDK